MKVLLPSPHQGQEEVLDNSSRYNVVACGRRWGKTDMGVTIVTMAALQAKPAGWFAPTYKLLDEAWERCLEVGGDAISKANKQERTIRFRTGGRIDFWTLRQTGGQSVAGRGRAYAEAVVDEAAMAPYLEQDFNEAIRPTLTDYQGRAWFLSTPFGRNFFWRLFIKGQAAEEGWGAWRMPTATNPFISPAEVEQAERDLPRDAFAQEYLAKFLDDAANPFGLDAIKRCTVPEVAEGPPVCWGVDLAKSTDWTVAVALNAEGAICGFQRWQADWRNTIARVSAMVGDTPAFVDATGVGDPIVEQLQQKCPNVEGYKFTMTSKQTLMEGLAVAIQQGRVALPEATTPARVLINELEAFRFEYLPSGVRYTAPEGCHDDCVDALALAVQRSLTMTPAASLSIRGDWDDDAEEAWLDGPAWERYFDG